MNTTTVLCWIRPEDEIRPGDEVTTTTSEFGFDCLTGTFDEEADIPVEIIGEHISEDYSEYVHGKHNNGGCYGYDYWRVVEVLP